MFNRLSTITDFAKHLGKTLEKSLVLSKILRSKENRWYYYILCYVCVYTYLSDVRVSPVIQCAAHTVRTP